MKKRQHTVPRCYLANFADKDGFVWVLDTKDKIFRIKPENILIENNFYTITLKSGEKSLIMEDSLSDIEGLYVEIFRNKIEKNIPLADQERAVVSVFIGTLYLRTRPQREGIRKMLQSLEKDMEEWKKQFESLTQEQRDSASAGIPRDKSRGISLTEVKEYIDDFEDNYPRAIMDSLPGVAQIIFDMKWAIFFNNDGLFVTCDDPVTLLRPASIKKFGPNAIGSVPNLIYKDVELTLPLSRNRLLLAGWILEQNSYLLMDNNLAKLMDHRTITNSSERIIADSEAKVISIKDLYTETAYKQNQK